MKIVTDCRVPDGYFLSEEWLKQQGLDDTVGHTCTDESPCDVRRAATQGA